MERLTLVSPYGPAAPSTRVRLYEWADHLGLDVARWEYAGLGRNGMGTLVRRPLAAPLAEWRTRAAARQVEDSILVLSREASPFSRGGLESRLLQASLRGIYDLDDALFADHEGWRRLLAKGAKCRRAIEAADRVIVGNDYLADYASKFASELTVIPTCIEPGAYQRKTSYELTDPPTLVWLGSPSTEQYLEEIAPALREVNRVFGARVVLISGPKAPDHCEFGDFVRRVPWDPRGVASELAAADIALGPLRDDVYARGKCAYKLLQYAAAGLPMVASPVGANELAIGRLGGLAARSHDDWVDGLISLLGASAGERRARGATAVAGVQAHYSFEVWATTWKEAVGI